MSKNSTASRNDKIVNFLARIIRGALSVVGVFKRDTILSILAEKLVPVASVDVGGTVLRFWGFGGWPLYRGRSVLQKERLTIEWLNGFEEGAVFWDIGSNVGVFSIYAAVIKGAEVFSFEPSLANVAVQAKNIEINGLDEHITLLPIALSDHTKIDRLNMIATQAGNTGGQFGQESEGVVFKQACLGFSFDGFVEAFSPPFPTYIKIDVDGIELMILKGADNALKRSELKSIILEADKREKNFDEIHAFLKGYGFRAERSEETVPGKDTVYNIVFTR
jgi:FkbM family methyltransferase